MIEHPMSTDIRIFLVDDHAFFRDMQVRMIEMQPGLTVVGQAATVRDAMSSIACAVDVFVIDLSMDGDAIAGMDLLNQLRAAYSDVPCIVLSGQLAIQHEAAVLEAGAARFVEKGTPSDLFTAIRDVAGSRVGS